MSVSDLDEVLVLCKVGNTDCHDWLITKMGSENVMCSLSASRVHALFVRPINENAVAERSGAQIPQGPLIPEMMREMS